MTAPFHPIVFLPAEYDVLDFSRPGPQTRRSPYRIGRYGEKRVGVYTDELFAGQRDNHVGLDIGAPAGTPIFAFDKGRILYIQENSSAGDYGPTLVTEHRLAGEGQSLFVLWGHLSRASLNLHRAGDSLEKGQLIGWMGDETENGGWPPHLHFQLSRLDPKKADMPGVVSDEDRDKAFALYPDPRMIVGPIY